METAIENISIKNSEITCKKSGQTMTLSNFAYSVYVNPGAEIALDQADVPSLEALGTYRHPQVNWKPDQEGRAQFYPAHANGAEDACRGRSRNRTYRSDKNMDGC